MRAGDPARPTPGTGPRMPARDTVNTGFQLGGPPGSPSSPALRRAAAIATRRRGSPTAALVDGYERDLLLTAALGLAIPAIAASSRQLRPSAEAVAELAVAG